jgi:carbonic anhydrase
MGKLENLLINNRTWAAKMLAQDPDFFSRLVHKQSPKYLWIGCSDSRVPANEILGLDPGEVFVHRNVANLLVHTDMNALSVLEYAVEVLRVEHIIVCGHYGCGGIREALRNHQLGLIDQWLQHIRDVYVENKNAFAPLTSESERNNLLCRLNVLEQVHNICRTSIVQRAWLNNQPLSIHPWVYDLADGLLHPLAEPIASYAEIPAHYQIHISESS